MGLPLNLKWKIEPLWVSLEKQLPSTKVEKEGVGFRESNQEWLLENSRLYSL